MLLASFAAGSLVALHGLQAPFLAAGAAFVAAAALWIWSFPKPRPAHVHLDPKDSPHAPAA